MDILFESRFISGMATEYMIPSMAGCRVFWDYEGISMWKMGTSLVELEPVRASRYVAPPAESARRDTNQRLALTVRISPHCHIGALHQLAHVSFAVYLNKNFAGPTSKAWQHSPWGQKCRCKYNLLAYITCQLYLHIMRSKYSSVYIKLLWCHNARNLNAHLSVIEGEKLKSSISIFKDLLLTWPYFI